MAARYTIIGHNNDTALAMGIAAERNLADGVKRPRAIDHWLILVKKGDVKIIELRSFSCAANETNMISGKFKWEFVDTPSEIKLSDRDGISHTGVVFPIYREDIVEPRYNGVVGEVVFLSPILSATGESLIWERVLVSYNYETEREMWFLQYRLFGTEDPYHPFARTKTLLVDSGEVLDEADYAAISFPVSRGKLFSGEFYKRLLKYTDVQEVEEDVWCFSHDQTYGGTLYKAVENTAAAPFIEFVPMLATLNGGASDIGDVLAAPGCRRKHYAFDIFSSIEADHYYVVDICSDTAIRRDAYPGEPVPVDPGYIMFYSNTSLVVRKYKKIDDSLVTTFNLTPAALDWNMQGTSILHQTQCTENAAQQYGVYSDQPHLLRILPQQGCGGVLVTTDENGAKTEYPILPCIFVLQDFLEVNNSSDPVVTVGNYRTGGPTTYLDINMYQQAAVLWLGGTPFGGEHTWAGVDAAVLSSNGFSIGTMREWTSCVGDGSAILVQANPHKGNYRDIVFVEPLVSPSEVVVKLYDSDVLYSPLGEIGGFHYTYILTVGELTFTRDMVAEIPSPDFGAGTLDILHADTAAFLSQGGLAATYGGTGGDGYSTYTVTTIVPGAELDINLSFKSDIIAVSSIQAVFSVTIAGDRPVVTLKHTQDQARVLRIQEI